MPTPLTVTFTIKTAYGYLSPQKPTGSGTAVRWAYKASAGASEQLEITLPDTAAIRDGLAQLLAGPPHERQDQPDRLGPPWPDASLAPREWFMALVADRLPDSLTGLDWAREAQKLIISLEQQGAFASRGATLNPPNKTAGDRTKLSFDGGATWYRVGFGEGMSKPAGTPDADKWVWLGPQV